MSDISPVVKYYYTYTTYYAVLAPKNPKPKQEKTNLICFFFIVKHLVDYLIFTLNISMHF